MQKTEQFSKTHILNRMIALLNEKGWTQNALARDKDGCGVVPEDRDAVKFDIMGALYCVEYKYQQPAVVRLGREVRAAIHKALLTMSTTKSVVELIHQDNFAYYINKYNDTPGRSKLEILRLLEKAKEY